MKRLSIVLVLSAMGLSAVLVSPADAAHADKHKKSSVATQSKAPRPVYQGGVLVGPLYNGQDYLGDDPDPNIRAYLLKDKTRYGGAR
jgi:hypothetical protein